jgi:hypothetical protein
VLLSRRAGFKGVVALAWRRMLQVPDPGDPRLRTFTDHWLGKGVGQ